jgi:hypothetical protein
MKLLPLLLCTLLLAACASSRPALSEGAPIPDDFWLAVTVLGPTQPNAAAYESLPRPLRPARYVLEPDRVLRAGLGPAASDKSYPPRTRQLSPEQHRRVWQDLLATGLTADDHPASVSAAPESAPQGQTLYILSFHAGEHHGVRALQAAPEPAPDSAKLGALIDTLADLAWIKRGP